MDIAIYGKRAKVYTIKLGSSQLEGLRVLVQHPEGLSGDQLRIIMDKPRSQPTDRMMHGLIKRGFVKWHAADTVVYCITPAGRKYLRETTVKKD